MKILVTGSSGHLGEALMRTLKAQGKEVVGCDLRPSSFTDYTGDLADKSFAERCMEGVNVVIHTATLHKPHVVTHSKQDFINANISATLNLLEISVAQKVSAFLFTSTTSTFGDAMQPGHENEAVWVTEELVPSPKNIYGVTKTAAEDLCQIFHRNYDLPCLILRTSRFFPEEDDRATLRQQYGNDNLKANELLHRRVDVADVVEAHLLAIDKAPQIGFSKYIISATSPFQQEQLKPLLTDAPSVVEAIYPGFKALYAKQDWTMFPEIGRVYVNDKARNELGWNPLYDFAHVLNCLRTNQPYTSELARQVGVKGYHKQQFENGPYPVE